MDSYDVNTFISNNLIDALTKITGHKRGRTVIGKNEKQIQFDAARINKSSIIIDVVTNSIIDSIIEFYDVDNTPQNRKNITSLFYVDHHYLDSTNEYGAVQLHINKGSDFKEIYDEGKGLYNDKTIIFEDRIVERISKLIDELKKKYPEWVERTEFKKSEILPYVKTKFQGDDFAKSIYDWNTTFETLEKLFYEYSFDNLEDVDYEKYVGIIDRNLDKLKQYVEKNDYKTYIGYEKMYPNIGIETLEQSTIYDKKYFSDYINSLKDIGISINLFDKDFIEFLDKFKKFISK